MTTSRTKLKPIFRRAAEKLDSSWPIKIWCLSILLTVWMIWPAPLYFSNAVIGSPDGDGMKHLWTLWWIQESVVSLHAVPFYTTLINYPFGIDLYPIEPLNGLVISALAWLPLIYSTNLIAVVNLTMTGVLAGYFGRAISRGDEGGIVAGILVQTSAFSYFSIHAGVGELQHLWLLPLGLWMWIRLRERMHYKDAVLLGLILAGAVLSCFYYGFFLAMAVSLLSATTFLAGSKTLKLLTRYVLAAVLSAMIALPVISKFSTSYGESEPPDIGLMSYIFDGFHGQPTTDPPSARLELSQLVSHRSPADHDRDQLAYGGGRYLGWPAIILLLSTVWLAPRRAAPWVLLAILAVSLAMGSYLVGTGGEVVISGEGACSDRGTSCYQMPFLYLNRALGQLAEPLNFPVRFLSLVSVTIGALGAIFAATRFRGRSLGTLAIGLALLNAVDVRANQLIPSPMQSFSPGIYPELTEPAVSGPYLDVSQALRSDPETRGASQSAQMAHRQPIQSVPIERVEKFAEEGQEWAIALPFMRELANVVVTHVVADLPRDSHRMDIALLHSQGFKGVLLLGSGPNGLIPKELLDSLSSLFGEPVTQSHSSALFDIPQIDYTEAEFESWERAHRLQVMEVSGLSSSLNRQLR